MYLKIENEEVNIALRAVPQGEHAGETLAWPTWGVSNFTVILIH